MKSLGKKPGKCKCDAERGFHTCTKKEHYRQALLEAADKLEDEQHAKVWQDLVRQLRISAGRKNE